MTIEYDQNSTFPNPSFMDGPGPKFIVAALFAIGAAKQFHFAENITPVQMIYINESVLNVSKWFFALTAFFNFGAGMMQVGKNLANRENSTRPK